MEKSTAILFCEILIKTFGLYAMPHYNRQYRDYEIFVNHNVENFDVEKICVFFDVKFLDCFYDRFGNNDSMVVLAKFAS